MTNPPAPDPPVPEAVSEATPMSNVDRLRAHLKADGIALALLDACTAGSGAGANSRMLQAIDTHFSEKKPTDGDAPAPKD